MDRVSKAERELVRKMQRQTNADRIRSMTDEELAELIANYAGCAHCPGYRVPCDNRCKEYWLDWLKQEADT